MGIGRQGNAGDRGALGAGHLGNRKRAEHMLPVPTTNPAPSVRTCALTTPSTDIQSTTKKRTPLRRETSEPDAKRPIRIPRPQKALLPDNLGKYAVRDTEAVTRLGWTEFVRP